ncbi:unnamed protein product [Paramecium sonneborni]|uniref:Uncharacterized protein n=1 Tax=Paramecium sonneborni TaxID=65129 RepID=A0A8S1KYJ9_9CILI|nr:unnamed protein product [Paramecium sonneborni]
MLTLQKQTQFEIQKQMKTINQKECYRKIKEISLKISNQSINLLKYFFPNINIYASLKKIYIQYQ